MKKIIVPALVFLLATACEKNTLSAPAAATASTTTHSANRQFPGCDYTMVYNSDGDFVTCACPSKNCAKDAAAAISLEPIDAAIAKGTVKDFFNSTDWETNFPYLGNEPELVYGLQHGDYTLVRQKNADGELFYRIILSTQNANTPNAGIYAIEIQ
jgi:hypothetical protein